MCRYHVYPLPSSLETVVLSTFILVFSAVFTLGMSIRELWSLWRSSGLVPAWPFPRYVTRVCPVESADGRSSSGFT